MRVQLRTNVKHLQGTLMVPSDKSISHRSIMFGAISSGKTTITNFLRGEDCLSMTGRQSPLRGKDLQA